MQGRPWVRWPLMESLEFINISLHLLGEGVEEPLNNYLFLNANIIWKENNAFYFLCHLLLFSFPFHLISILIVPRLLLPFCQYCITLVTLNSLWWHSNLFRWRLSLMFFAQSQKMFLSCAFGQYYRGKEYSLSNVTQIHKSSHLCWSIPFLITAVSLP